MTELVQQGATLVPARPEVDWERHKGDKRPKILPPPGVTWRNPSTNRKVGHRYYTRVTTYADALTESYNLTAWKLRRLALGLGQRADYVRLAASYTDEDRDRDALDELVGKALEAAGPNKADLGTALHSLTERLDRGEDLGTPPDEVLPDLAAYTALVEGVLSMLLREPRTVCDELECAGTPDTIAVIAEQPPTDWGPACDCPPERPRVVDTKTGSIRYPGKMSTQLSIYSRSALYDPATGERTPLDVCPHWGAIVHLPVETGEAALFWLDLEHGWRGAELAGPVRTWRAVKADDILRPFATVKPVKVVDGEVTRIEPRLASVNLTAAEPIVDITQQLAASNAHAQQLAREAADAADRAEAAEARVDQLARDDEGDEAALHEDLAAGPDSTPFADEACDVRVVNAEHPDEPAEHWCATHDKGWPHERLDPAPGYLENGDDLAAVLEETRRAGIPVTPGPDTCAHSGGLTIPAKGGGLVCRDCGQPGGFRSEGRGVVTTVVEQPATAEPVEWPGVDDLEIAARVEAGEADTELELVEQLASGPDSDAEDEPEVEPPGPLTREADEIAAAITRCVTVRELELLSSTAWRSWGPEHKTLATEVHARLEHAERVERPRAALEAAIIAADSVMRLEAAMTEGAELLTDELRDLASARWREIRAAERGVRA